MTERQLDLFDQVTPEAIAVLALQKVGAPAGAPPAAMEAASSNVTVFPVVKRRRSVAPIGGTRFAAVAPFPQDRRRSKVMDVATKLLAKTTSRAVDHYRLQVSDAMSVHLRSRGVPIERHCEEIRRFWVAVDCEVARRLSGRQRPGGVA